MKFPNLKYYLFILELIGRWALFMIGPFIPFFGWFIIYNILLYTLDKQHLSEEIDSYVLITSVMIHISILFSMVFLTN